MLSLQTNVGQHFKQKRNQKKSKNKKTKNP